MQFEERPYVDLSPRPCVSTFPSNVGLGLGGVMKHPPLSFPLSGVPMQSKDRK